MEMLLQNMDNQMKDSMRAPWVAGDFGAIAREMGIPEAEGFVARMELEPGARVRISPAVPVTLPSL